MSYSATHNQPYRSRTPEYDSSPGPSSGAVTPTTTQSTFLSSSVSSLWGGLVRRFSSESPATTQGRNPSSSPTHKGPYHSHTFDDGYSHGSSLDGVYSPQCSRRAASPIRPPPLEPIQLKGFAADTAADARLLTPAIAEEVRIMVPARLSLVDEWNLVYSLDQDGASLATLYDKCDAYRGKRVGFVLVVKDLEGGVSRYL